MYLPNYKNGSIVNLMSSLKKSFGGKSIYRRLKGFDVDKISGKDVVFVVVDGLGYEYLLKYGQKSFLLENLKSKMTSAFPATTPVCFTTFLTGVPAQQHGLAGWFMYFKEIGMIALTLPFVSRAGGIDLKEKIKYEKIFNQQSIFEDIEADSFFIASEHYVDSEYSKLASKGAKRLPFSSLEDFFGKIKKTLKTKGKRKAIVAYWGEFDAACHHNGTDSQEARNQFEEMDKKISALAKYLKNKNTVIIVTADHGLIDTKEKNKIIKLENHPKFVETLTMPLSGEPRAVYCYVKPSKVKQFENYVKNKFGKCCDMYKSEELIKKNYFGLFKPNVKLKERVGDYVLIMKENYIMKDFLVGEIKNINIGNHGGISKEEMFVPLIVIEN